MPNRRSHRRKKRTPKRESPARLNQSSGPSEVDHQELKARTTLPMPSREALVNHSEVSSNGDVQNPGHIDLRQEQVTEEVRNSLQNHDRVVSGRRYCLLTINETTR